MKEYKLVKIGHMLSASSLIKSAEQRLNKLVTEGLGILNVSFGPNGVVVSSFFKIYR